MAIRISSDLFFDLDWYNHIVWLDYTPSNRFHPWWTTGNIRCFGIGSPEKTLDCQTKCDILGHTLSMLAKFTCGINASKQRKNECVVCTTFRSHP